MSPLTEREMQIANLVTEGLSNRQISERLGISYSTVKNHMQKVLAKQGIHSRVLVSKATKANRSKLHARQTLAHLRELAANPETRGELRALIISLFPELFGEL
jgi:DNA-binding CsgD family transcriptional regulator